MTRNWEEGQTACAVINGEVYCSGGNGNTIYLGDGSTTGSTTPIKVSNIENDVIDMCLTADNFCALDKKRRLKCWGSNSVGLVGDGTTSTRTSPVVTFNSGVEQVSCNASHVCAIVNGGVKCWGQNSYGELGNGTTTNSISPVDVVGLGAGSNVTSISVGRFYSCAIKNQEAYCWGENTKGSLGDGTTTSTLTPVAVQGLTGNITKIETNYGCNSSCANTTCVIIDGGVKCWGNNDSFQFGDGSTTDSLTPVSSTGLTSGVTDLSLSGMGGCAIQNNKIKCWGGNTQGSLGNGTTVDSSIPVLINSSLNFTSLSHGGRGVCAVSQDGKIYCWGANSFGEFGFGVSTELNPVQSFLNL
jgi:alpha-tubulin suppressor-like RCC1 family protein